MELGVTYLTLGKNEQAQDIFASLIKANPQDSFASAHLGFILKSKATDQNDLEMLAQSAQLLDSALKSGQAFEGLFYFHLGDAYRRLGDNVQADQVYQLGSLRGVFPSFWQRSLYNEPGLQAKPVWTLPESGIEADLERLRSHWQLIRDEALSLYDEKNGGFFMDESENLKDVGYWGQFDLFVQGREVKKNCAKAKKTCQLINAIPEIRNCRRGQVKFSVMKSGTHVHAHSGPTNCRLRAHLGLQVPRSEPGNSNGTKLRVSDKFLTWADGEMFIFDDSFDHEVWHSNDQGLPRFVLIVDFWHPELSAEKRASLPAI